MLSAVTALPVAADGFRINFKTPGGTVCGGDSKYGNGVSCFVHAENEPIRPRPADCIFDWGGEFYLPANGKPRLECVSDYVYHPAPPVLQYGQTISGRGWKCTSAPSGLRCENNRKHGFKLTRKHQVLF